MSDPAQQIRRETQLLREQGLEIERNLSLSSKLSASLAKLAVQIREVQNEQRQLELQARKSDLIMGAEPKSDIEGVVVGRNETLQVKVWKAFCSPHADFTLVTSPRVSCDRRQLWEQEGFEPRGRLP